MNFEIPQPLKAEHAELHAELADARRAGGRISEAAEEVAKRLHPHFIREEEIALPPLCLLAPLAAGGVAPEMADVLALTDRLEAELPVMLAEHKQIMAALGDLVVAANAEKRPKYARFAEKLMSHARIEEEVLYPAALLVGLYLKLRLGR
ncbi:hemerythrin domain-containing protein [Rhizobium bangladeshense]|uniref:hemerythrin domain-containing protein n=1 Tax=Rhizobium bangladeshense TaxID=1138189 RepID=UPI001C834280|nr:hemerythrin domain-containing protein [Rhizobium bangladeshense]MBX4893232.1 hypothetical protein [Rhizobium bangladeshense]MBX4898833.1 hypothetical protein [Rhizobium bangladeshense]MBY3616869.1 hemerythrin domain-containing protein [Rhizobium bangladeshense]